MGGFKEYDQYDGLGLAELVKGRQVTAGELCEEAIDRVERLNPRLNAVIRPMYEIGRQTAGGALPDGPFQGVPFLLKDILDAYAGVPMTSGSRALQHYVPDFDSELVRRFKQAGVVPLGKTSTPEFALVAFTEPELFGACRNPWDLERTPGGSSGGSAAAVSAGIVPIASASDGGGSIRIPASHCGLFGLKPSRGRTPVGPQYGEVWQGLSQGHVLTRSVRDSAAMLDATHGPDPGAPYSIVPPARPYREEIAMAPRPLRIGFSTKSPVGKPVDPEAVRAVQQAAKLLADLGHQVEEAEPAVDGPALAISYITLYTGEVAADLAEIEAVHGAAAARLVEPATRTLGLLGKAVSAGELVAARREWNKAGRAMAAYFATYDLYLTPTVARPPVRVGELAPRGADLAAMTVMNSLGAGGLLKAAGVVERVALENLAATPFTQLANMTGLPAMSVPLYWTPDGLPLGVQFVAPHGDEATLFRLAAQLEQAAPWFDRRPTLVG